MPNDAVIKEYREILDILGRGDIRELEFASGVVDSFPHGCDAFVTTHWITHAIFSASLDSVNWMIGKGVEINFRDGEGYTPLHSCIELQGSEKYPMLRRLIEVGADLNAHGISDWTPLHLAAMRDDHKALKILLEANADPSVRTRIDGCETAEEEARHFGHPASADIIAMYS